MLYALWFEATEVRLTLMRIEQHVAALLAAPLPGGQAGPALAGGGLALLAPASLGATERDEWLRAYA
jgi:hypothetical protein